MPGAEVAKGKPYLTIVGGNIVQKVDKDTEGARFREYELSNGTKGAKWEKVFMSWSGKIEGITFKDTDYGEVCNVEFDDAILTLNVSNRYFSDFACKLCSADLSREILVHPYDMETQGGRKTGVSVQQGGEKLKNHFYDGSKNLHGFPEVDQAKAVKKTYWKTYFIEVADFLVEELKKLKFTTTPQVVANVDEDLPDFLKDANF